MSEPLNLRPAEEVIDAMFTPYRKRIAELERENVELRKDVERLNHVERHGCWQVTHDEWRPRTDGTNIRDRVTVVEGWIATDGANDDLIKPTLREAIDAAIASEKENERGR